VIDTSKIGGACASGESPLNWNVKGPTGPQGVQGVQGPQGVKGDKGDPGTTGSSGAAGTNGTNDTNGTDGISGYEIVTQDQTFNVPDYGASVRAACPAGKHVLGGGAEITDSSRFAPELTGSGPILGGIDWEAKVGANLAPLQDEADDDGVDFFVNAGELVATIRVWAICAKTSS